MLRSLVVPALLVLAACSAKAATSPDGPAGPPGAASAPVASTPPVADAGPAEAAAPATAASASAAPAAVPSASAAPSASAPAEGPLPSVGVVNIGMHIGGGPNDDITKDPIRRSVAPHFDEFRRCFAHVDDASKGGDFGVDLRIDRAGGRAQVSHPRSALKGKEFRECVVRTFEAIEFLKPRGGTTTVSYSLRFSPKKGDR